MGLRFINLGINLLNPLEVDITTYGGILCCAGIKQY